jgi:hypothetical protein
MSSDRLPTVPFTSIAERQPNISGEFLTMLPTNMTREEYLNLSATDELPDEPHLYVIPAVYDKRTGQWWTADSEVHVLQDRNGGNVAVRTAVHVTDDVIAWAPIPNPSNYTSVVLT